MSLGWRIFAREGSLSNKSILCVDDSATMRTIIEKTFFAEPYDMVTVPSGEVAIEKARDIQPDLILADAGMVGMTGYDVCKAIRGMATDTWVERRKFSGWSYLAKHFEKWLMMYSEGTSQADAGSWGPWRDEGFATRKDWEDYHGQK